MKLAFITDEATQDFQEAVELAKRCGLQGLELRSVNDTPIDRIDHETLREWKAQLDREGLQVCSLASSFYKCSLVTKGTLGKGDLGQSGNVAEQEVLLEEEMRKLSRLCDAADILGCRSLRGFAFFTPEAEDISGETYSRQTVFGKTISGDAVSVKPVSGEAVSGKTMPEERIPEDTVLNSRFLTAEQLAPYFERPARLLRERGKKLLLEADPSVNTTNHAAVAKLLSLLDREIFGAIYDPGNDIYDPLGENPFPQGYQAIRPYLGHVHIKDVVLKEGKPFCVKPGTGLVDYPGLLKALTEDGYQGWLSLEPHYRKDIVLTEEQMRIPQGTDFSRGGREALEESAEALKRLIREGGMAL